MKIIDTKILQRSVVERIITSVSYDSGDFNTCSTWYGDGETLDNILYGEGNRGDGRGMQYPYLNAHGNSGYIVGGMYFDSYARMRNFTNKGLFYY